MTDYVLANQPRTSFRAELNLIIAALVSQAASPTPPTTTFPGQIWADTSGASLVLRVRNAGNTAWSPLLVASGGALVVDGAAASVLLKDIPAAVGRNTVRLRLSGDRLTQALLDNAGALVEVLAETQVNDDGAIRHAFKIGDVEKLVINAAGVLVDGLPIGGTVLPSSYAPLVAGEEWVVSAPLQEISNGRTVVRFRVGFHAAGQVRLRIVHRRASSGSANTSQAQVVRNGQVIHSWVTSETAAQTRTVVVDVARHDIVEVRHVQVAAAGTGPSRMVSAEMGLNTANSASYFVCGREEDV